MTSLLYRGHEYTRLNSSAGKPEVQLTYRRKIYAASRSALPIEKSSLGKINMVYRGVPYTK